MRVCVCVCQLPKSSLNMDIHAVSPASLNPASLSLSSLSSGLSDESDEGSFFLDFGGSLNAGFGFSFIFTALSWDKAELENLQTKNVNVYACHQDISGSSSQAQKRRCESWEPS